MLSDLFLSDLSVASPLSALVSLSGCLQRQRNQQ